MAIYIRDIWINVKKVDLYRIVFPVVEIKNLVKNYLSFSINF